MEEFRIEPKKIKVSHISPEIDIFQSFDKIIIKTSLRFMNKLKI